MSRIADTITSFLNKTVGRRVQLLQMGKLSHAQRRSAADGRDQMPAGVALAFYNVVLAGFEHIEMTARASIHTTRVGQDGSR